MAPTYIGFPFDSHCAKKVEKSGGKAKLAGRSECKKKAGESEKKGFRFSRSDKKRCKADKRLKRIFSYEFEFNAKIMNMLKEIDPYFSVKYCK